MSTETEIRPLPAALAGTLAAWGDAHPRRDEPLIALAGSSLTPAAIARAAREPDTEDGRLVCRLFNLGLAEVELERMLAPYLADLAAWTADETGIREAVAADVPAMLALKTRVTAETYGPHGTPEQLAAWQQRFCTTEYFNERLAAGDRFYLRDTPDRTLAAMAALKVRDGRAYFGDLYVTAASRRHGLARELTARVLADARELDLPEAVCDVWSTNPVALAFVTGAGFRPVSDYVEQNYQVLVHRLNRQLTP